MAAIQIEIATKLTVNPYRYGNSETLNDIGHNDESLDLCHSNL